MIVLLFMLFTSSVGFTVGESGSGGEQSEWQRRKEEEALKARNLSPTNYLNRQGPGPTQPVVSNPAPKKSQNDSGKKKSGSGNADHKGALPKKSSKTQSQGQPITQPKTLNEAITLSTKMRQDAEVKIDFYKKQIEEATEGNMPAWQAQETAAFAREEIRRLETEKKSWEKMHQEAKLRIDAEASQAESLKSLTPNEMVNDSPVNANEPFSPKAEENSALANAFPKEGALESQEKKGNTDSLRARLREALRAQAENLQSSEEDSENAGSATGAAASLLEENRSPASTFDNTTPQAPAFGLDGSETDAEVKKLVREGQLLQYSWLGAEDGPSLFEIVRKSIRSHAPDWQKPSR